MRNPLDQSITEQSTFWSEDSRSHASPSAPPESAKAPTTRDGSGRKWLGSSDLFDPVGSSLRTSLVSELSALTGCSLTWNRSATPHGRSWWVLTTLERPTSESEYSSLPTIKAADGRPKGNASSRKSHGLDAMARAGMLPTLLASYGDRPMRGKNSPGGATLLATLTARDRRSGKASEATMDRNARPLSEQIGGLLNPNWCEWFMGFPDNYTEI